jgi:hypothetical protein
MADAAWKDCRTCLSAAEVGMKTEFTSNLMVHDLHGAEVPATLSGASNTNTSCLLSFYEVM